MAADDGSESGPLDPFLRDLLHAFASGMQVSARKRRYGAAEKERALEVVRQGGSATNAAKLIGATPSSVRAWCKIAGLMR
jgi:hypothetical protein